MNIDREKGKEKKPRGLDNCYELWMAFNRHIFALCDFILSSLLRILAYEDRIRLRKE